MKHLKILHKYYSKHRLKHWVLKRGRASIWRRLTEACVAWAGDGRNGTDRRRLDRASVAASRWPTTAATKEVLATWMAVATATRPVEWTSERLLLLLLLVMAYWSLSGSLEPTCLHNTNNTARYSPPSGEWNRKTRYSTTRVRVASPPTFASLNYCRKLLTLQHATLRQ